MGGSVERWDDSLTRKKPLSALGSLSPFFSSKRKRRREKGPKGCSYFPLLPIEENGSLFLPLPPWLFPFFIFPLRVLVTWSFRLRPRPRPRPVVVVVGWLSNNVVAGCGGEEQEEEWRRHLLAVKRKGSGGQTAAADAALRRRVRRRRHRQTTN